MGVFTYDDPDQISSKTRIFENSFAFFYQHAPALTFLFGQLPAEVTFQS